MLLRTIIRVAVAFAATAATMSTTVNAASTYPIDVPFFQAAIFFMTGLEPDFCVVVRNTPDGFLALREGPGTRFRMKAKLKPGELLIADTRSCMDDICDEKGQWTFINYVPRLDGRLEQLKHLTQGWVATKFTEQVPLGRCSSRYS